MDNIYIFSDGELRKKNNTIEFISKNNKKILPINNVQDIKVFSNVSFNNKFLALLTKYKIALHVFSYYKNYMGSYIPDDLNYEGKTLLNQVNNYQIYEKRLYLAKMIIFSAINNMKNNLKLYKINYDENKIKKIIIKLNEVESTDQIMIVEAEFRRFYYSNFDNIINNKNFKFEKRSKRPPQNEINSVISFGNSVFYSECVRIINKVRLFNCIGYLHSNERNNSLSLDISEIFKPIIIDRLVFDLFKNNEFNKKDFQKMKNGIYLSTSGKKKFIKSYDEKLKETFILNNNNKHISYRELIENELYSLKNYINKQEPNYIPFMERM
ncbi:type I-B CRISPR-associated endonuclease Cas1b [Oceanotoga sp. DSM 15011]|uniref:type I-B CRISPR-associated endonuclease Cas1b n=1 Tax=Oceanotoga sp. DSM 15011 TaxID=2984951 RepID=UPI0021F4B94C|nr:type I-B CRISPR-associated endonuclease Cas1b [Oceanotoga sp. DSM 15011]UYP01290.1 type I-B CRISPR-associated endonuclease Cas1b [Oceanotoga sp. DSM 15011]